MWTRGEADGARVVGSDLSGRHGQYKCSNGNTQACSLTAFSRDALVNVEGGRTNEAQNEVFSRRRCV